MGIVDVHQHNGPWPYAGRWGGVEENLRLMAARGIGAAILSSSKAIVSDMAEGNAELAEAIAPRPQLYAYVVVNPTTRAASERELARYEGAPRFVGAKIHTHYSGCAMTDPRLAPMFGVLQEWGRPLLIHTWGAAAIAALSGLAERFPALRIIVAHAGGDAWREAIAAAEQRPNLWLDFAGSTPYAGAIARAVATLGASRLVFGSDATLFDPLYMLAHWESIPMSAADRALAMGGVATRLFAL